MKITVEFDNGETQVFSEVSDAFLAVALFEPKVKKDTDEIVLVHQCRSHSWGADVRSLLKELRQATEELEIVRRKGT